MTLAIFLLLIHPWKNKLGYSKMTNPFKLATARYLLDGTLRPKVANFGLASLVNRAKTHLCPADAALSGTPRRRFGWSYTSPGSVMSTASACSS